MRNERIATRCVCCGSETLDSSPAVLMPFVAHRVFGWTPVTIDESWGLDTIPSGRAFSICKSMYCRVCGHLFLDIRFDDVEMQRLYSGYRQADYVRMRELYEPGYRERNDVLKDGVPYVPSIEHFLRPFLPAAPRVLDWGGDTGRNTPFRNRCAAHLIYDIGQAVPVPGARLISRHEAANTTHDLICCSMVLEHVPYPVDLLTDIRQVMSAHTVLYIEVPLEKLIREEYDNPHHYKRHWHEHVNFFCRRSLDAVIDRAGLDIIARDVIVATFEGGEIHVLQVACNLR